MAKKLIEIASEIVQTQVSLNPMSATDIAASLREVFKTLQEIQKREEEGGELLSTLALTSEDSSKDVKPALTPEESIQNDKVICLECGAEMKLLTLKHLASHGLNSKEYKKKYGFPMKTPLAAKALTKARSKAAKKRGLPENLTKFLEARRQSKIPATGVAPQKKAAAGQTKLRKRAK